MSERKSVRKSVKIWLIFHCTMCFLWSWPGAPAGARPESANLTFVDRTSIENDRLVRSTALKTYMVATGFWQYWDMFAPDPASIDIWIQAVVTYQDGTVKDDLYPRIATSTIPKKYILERFRKYAERAQQDQYRFLWQPFAERIAYVAFTDPKNPPVQVTLIRKSRKVGPPGNDPDVDKFQEYAYFQYIVDQERLRNLGVHP